MTLYIVGLGPGDPDYVTIKALKTIERCRVAVAWKTILEQFGWLLDAKEVVEVDSGSVYETIDSAVKRASLESVCLLLRGDPSVAERNLMSFVERCCRMYGVECTVVSGVSSANLALAKVHIDLCDTILISFHSAKDIEKEFSSIKDVVRLKRYIVIYPRANAEDMALIARELLDLMDCDPRTYILQRLSSADESITVVKLSNLATQGLGIDSYTIIVVEPCSSGRNDERSCSSCCTRF